MLKFLNEQYGLDNISEIKLSNKVIKVNTQNKKYIVKEVNNYHLDELFLRMSLLHIDSFCLPLRGKNNLFVQEENEKQYLLFPFYQDIEKIGLDLKLSFFIKNIAYLHLKTYITIQSSDSYLENTINYLDNQIRELSDSLTSRIEVIERQDYHSPNDWYFLSNYAYFSSVINQASLHVSNLENIVKDEKSLKICLTYQNFSFDHILLNHEKIISCEKIAYNFAPVDLINIIKLVSLDSLDIVSFVEEYLSINKLLDYEKEYLMANLYIFIYQRFPNSNDDLNHLISIRRYLDQVSRLNEIIFSSSEIK